MTGLKTRRKIQLDGRAVGVGEPCYIIGEIGSNHDRDLDKAKRLVEACKEAGCDAVKFQSYTAEGIYSIYTPRLSEMDRGKVSPAGETPFELIKRIEMPIEWHSELRAHCDRVGITFCSTPFDESMVDVLEAVDTPFYKVASYELTHIPLLEKIARLKKPVILSTGNSDIEDVEYAVETLRQSGCDQYALLHCVSQYPAQYADMNLRCLQTLRKRFECPVGLSDHTLDNLSAIVSVALGMDIIEKHVTFDRKTMGPDHPFALEMDDLKGLVRAIRDAELALGDGVKVVKPSEEENHLLARRSLMAACDLKKGDTLTLEKIAVKRPALGIHPKQLKDAIGKQVARDVKCDHWITWEDLVGT
jgi:sialic acid synthase SpsE